MSADLIARRLRDLAPAAESGRRPACAQAMREAADALEAAQAETAEWQAKGDRAVADLGRALVDLAAAEARADRLAAEVDTEKAAHSVTSRYVVALRVERDRLAAVGDQLAEALHMPKGCACNVCTALAAWRALRGTDEEGENPQG